jgi:hypothetical protein
LVVAIIPSKKKESRESDSHQKPLAALDVATVFEIKPVYPKSRAGHG